MLGGKGRPDALLISEAPWIVVAEVASSATYNVLEQELDQGEAMAVCFALENPAESLLILDEASARRKARALGLRVIGSIGVLWRAASSGKIKSFENAVADIESTGFWLKPELKKKILADWARR